MIHRIANELLTISVNQVGAELCKIQSIPSGKDYMWEGNPEIWGSTSPVLFPVIGAIKKGFVIYNGKEYAFPRHGFVRNNPKVQLRSQTSDTLTFGLHWDDELLETYPFYFNFEISYTLKGNKIIITHQVSNEGQNLMYFSLGAHPAFKVPMNEGEAYEDYYLEFEESETDSTWLLAEGGLVGNITKAMLNESNILRLDSHLFDNDALIFKNLKSKKVSLRSEKPKPSITMEYQDFSYLGIWAKPNAPFVCIEPWLGIADSSDSDQKLENKEGILTLKAGDKFNASYSITVTE